MNQEIVTRLRNSFAHLLLELMNASSSTTVPTPRELPFSTMSESHWRRAIELWNTHARSLLATLPDRPCPACAGTASRWLFESYDSHQFHECGECGCWFTPKVVEWSVFEKLFALSPEAQQHAMAMMTERDDEAGRVTDMTRIGGYLDDLLPMLAAPSGAALQYLDAGCGVGHSLRAGLERGMIVQGVEVDDAAVALARKAGLPVATPRQIDSIPRGPYQLLTFWETLEHIARPLETIRQFVPFLAQGGLVAITVPNLNALATRIMQEDCDWVHGGYNTPGHVNLFHVPALARLLDRAGLTLLDAEGQYSGNLLELLAFVNGESRGAFDLLSPGSRRGRIADFMPALVGNVSPGIELLERYALLSPILFVVACRRGEEARFENAVAARRAARRQRLADRARELISFEVDYKAVSEEWHRMSDQHHEFAIRQHEQMQAEIDRRDQIISELRSKWERTLSYKLSRLRSKLARRG